MTKAAYQKRLRQSLKRLGGKKNTFNKLLTEFEFVSRTNGKVTTCLCGKQHLKKRFVVRNKQNGKRGIVGSKCRKLFKSYRGYAAVAK